MTEIWYAISALQGVEQLLAETSLTPEEEDALAKISILCHDLEVSIINRLDNK